MEQPRLSDNVKQAIANSRDEAIRLKNGATPQGSSSRQLVVQ